MSDTILYQSVLQKLGQLNPNNLAQLDAFLTGLIGHKSTSVTSKNDDEPQGKPRFAGRLPKKTAENLHLQLEKMREEWQ